MTDPSALLSLRTKKLGVLLRDARLSGGKSVAECAEALGVPAQMIEQYEMGHSAPSLPELEILAHFLAVPVEHFWGQQTLGIPTARKYDPQQLLGLRQRMVGVQVRQARLQAGLNQEKMARECGISVEALEKYENGALPIPVPHLEAIARAADRSPKDFLDRHGPVGTWMVQQAALQGVMGMSPELQAFVSKPVNRPYLELAQRLSEMSVDKLRAVAEGLLEITL
jgi:transcriptional regulator with XRE-family HTH domain